MQEVIAKSLCPTAVFRLVLQAPFDIAIDKSKRFSKKRRIGQGGGEFTNIVSLLQDLKSWPEVYIENPTHLQHFKFIGGLQLGVAHGSSLEQEAVDFFPHQHIRPQSQGNYRISQGFCNLEVLGHNPQDIDFVGVTDELAVQKGLLVEIVRDAEPIVKENSATDELALGNTQGLEDAVTVQLPEGKLGVILRIRISKGQVLLILGKAAEVMKQGGHGSDAAVVLRKAETCTNPSNGRADTEGVFLFHVQAALVQGVRFLEGQDMVSKPVLKKPELFIIHLELFCLGWKWTLSGNYNSFGNRLSAWKWLCLSQGSMIQENC